MSVLKHFLTKLHPGLSVSGFMIINGGGDGWGRVGWWSRRGYTKLNIILTKKALISVTEFQFVDKTFC